MAMIGYDPERMVSLKGATQRAIDDLTGIASTDPLAAEAMAMVRSARSRLEQEWLPLIERVLASDDMVSSATLGLHPFARDAVLGMARAFEGAAAGSATDEALVAPVSRFAELDTDGDGELSHDELRAGAHDADEEIRGACAHLLARPLTLVNVALADERFAWRGGNEDVELDDLRLSPAMLATALAQNRAIRTIADPALFVSLDRAVTGEIDGQVSTRDVRAVLEHATDPDVRSALEYLLDEDLFGRLDREHAFADSDGRIAYDQVYALGVHQGAFDGLPDPTIPPALRDWFGPPEDTGARTAQFLHATVPPALGMGQVMIALYIPTPTAGFPGRDIFKSTGNDRGPDPHAHPSDSKGWAIIDYETGIVTARVNPSCSAQNDGACQNPLPITTDFGSVGYAAQRIPLIVDDTNRVLIDRLDNGRTKVRFGVLNTDKRFVAARLDATFEVWTNADGTVGLEWHRDAFPSMEAYHIYPDGQIVSLAHESAAHNGDRGLMRLWWTNTHGTGDG